MQPIAVGADEAGAPLKEHLAKYLQEHGYEVTDYGNGTEQDYPDVASRVAEAVSNREHDRALLVCGTGLGMAITANKIPGVRAVTAHDPYSAERARKSNDAQVLAMGSRVIAPEAAEKVLDHWLESEFQGGGSTEKVEKIKEIDAEFRGERSESI
ncbi:MAG: RpiB/LacA/LacB family sugar-phosphate isomerase [Solirubrobacterales bacterium]|nr:RpiB/LacA/LacB family sugar-phosphate isomerase [Solirubrobacterales bacterium]